MTVTPITMIPEREPIPLQAIELFGAEFVRLAARVTQLEMVANQTTPAPMPVILEEEIDPHFTTLEGFVGFLGEVVETRLGNARRWGPCWADHPGVVLRLTALWHAYESFRREPGAGFSRWILEHLDPHLEALLNVDGPFAGCSESRHVAGRHLPVGAR